MVERRIVLASTSPYRAHLLERLHLDFATAAPACDETAQPNESPAELVQRLALDKARSVAAGEDDALVIGSDQVAAIDDRILTKPGDHATAFEQLRLCSGRSVRFHTGLAVVDASNDQHRIDHDLYRVDFRALTDSEIDRYLQVEQPWDCAGSIRSEGYAAVLFERMQGDDPAALIGLPLIRLRALLAGFDLPLP